MTHVVRYNNDSCAILDTHALQCSVNLNQDILPLL